MLPILAGVLLLGVATFLYRAGAVAGSLIALLLIACGLLFWPLALAAAAIFSVVGLVQFVAGLFGARQRPAVG